MPIKSRTKRDVLVDHPSRSSVAPALGGSGKRGLTISRRYYYIARAARALLHVSRKPTPFSMSWRLEALSSASDRVSRGWRDGAA